MKLLFILLIIPFVLFGFHEQKESVQKNEKNDELTLEKTLTKAEPALGYVYKTVNNITKSIDQFLSNDYTPAEYTDSYINIETSLRNEKGNNSKFNSNIDVRLKLKKINDKYKIIINNNENKTSEKFEEKEEKVPYKDDNVNIGIQYESLKKYLAFKSSIGIKAISSPYIYLKGSIEKSYNLSENSKINLKEQIKYSDRFDFDYTTTIQYDKYMTQNITFIIHNEYFINSKNKIDNLYNSIRVNQILNSDEYINYVLGQNSNNNITNFKNKNIKSYISYRKFIKKWFYYDLVPEVNFINQNNYNEQYAFTLNVGILIGKWNK